MASALLDSAVCIGSNGGARRSSEIDVADDLGAILSRFDPGIDDVNFRQ